MQQHLHLLVVDRARPAALAAWYGSRWLLPIVGCHERMRIGPPVDEWASRHGLVVDAIGQWLGSVSPCENAVDWLVVGTVNRPEPAIEESGLRWTPLESLDPSAALTGYERVAVRQVMSGGALPSVAGPFGTMSWLDDVKAWVRDVIGAAEMGPVAPYRATAYEVVLGLAPGGDRVFFKGLTGDRALEPSVTSALARLVPQSFAPTLAIESRADGSTWWLTAECAGSPLSRDASLAGAPAVAAACAAVQRCVVAAADRLPELPHLDLSRAAASAIELLRSSTRGDRIAECCNWIGRACAEVAAAGIPDSWIALDLDPLNVLLDDRAVRFIDLDDSWMGPAPLAVATFARRTRRLQHWVAAAETDPEVLYRAYERAWPSLRVTDRQWRQLEIVSLAAEAHLDWRRVSRKVERGELGGGLDFARTRIARRLLTEVPGGVRALERAR